jgi:hypothetical protein
MAQLYEQQNQLFDALAVYESIETAQTDPELRERIDRLQERILRQKNYSYSQISKRIFTREEFERFRIIPGNDYAAYEESLRSVAVAGEEAFPEEIDIEEDDALTVVREPDPEPEPVLPEESPIVALSEPAIAEIYSLPAEEELQLAPDPEPEPEPVIPSAPWFPETVCEPMTASEPEEPVDMWHTMTIGTLIGRMLQRLDSEKRLEDLTLGEITGLLHND